MRHQHIDRFRLSWIAGLALLIIGAGPCGEASGQSNSDFYAYPKSFTDVGSLRNNPRQLTFNRMPGLSPDYRLGTGDEVEILVVGQPPLLREISAAGDVTIPFVGAVRIGGVTAEEAEATIAAAFKDRQLINDPQVLLTVTKYEAKTIYAFGELDRPGEYSVSFQMTLMDLVFIAGGLDFTAGQYGYLHRRTSPAPAPSTPAQVKAGMSAWMGRPESAPPGAEVIRIDLQPMRTGGVLERNILLQNGDVFYVPRREVQFVFLAGELKAPGAFELPAQKRTTASEAIAWAGGTTPTAKMSEGMLVRYEGGQRRQYLIDFQAVLKGRQLDLELRADDVIFIPTSQGKSAALNILSTIPRLVTYILVF